MLNMKNLIQVGAIKDGDILVWHRKNLGSSVELKVDQYGKLETADGKIFNSPTAAAKNFNGGVAINGWRVWTIKRNNESLAEVRKKYSNSAD